MRIALMSDIHANREAFAAALADARRRGFDRLALLGDIVGYGPDPEAAIDMAREEAARGAVVLKGNHDACIDADGDLNRDALAAIIWTRGRLSADRRAFLRGLPLAARIGEAFLAHASAYSPQAFLYVMDAGSAERCIRASPCRLTACGHTHAPALWFLAHSGVASLHTPADDARTPLPPPRRFLAVIGAVGQPRDGRPGAAYAMLDDERSEIEFLRVGYDHEATARKVVEAGLPPRLAQRLVTGL